MISENTIFYLFSTEAQAVASVSGLVAAAMVFRLQGHDQEMHDLIVWFADHVKAITAGDSAEKVLAKARTNIDVMSGERATEPVLAEMKDRAKHLARLTNRRKEIFSALNWLLFPSVAAIALSLLAIYLVPNYVPKEHWGLYCQLGILIGVAVPVVNFRAFRLIVESNVIVGERE